jgi:hypothetical protein
LIFSDRSSFQSLSRFPLSYNNPLWAQHRCRTYLMIKLWTKMIKTQKWLSLYWRRSERARIKSGIKRGHKKRVSRTRIKYISGAAAAAAAAERCYGQSRYYFLCPRSIPVMPTKSRSCLVLWNKSRGLLAYYSRESRVRVFGFFYTHTHIGVVHQCIVWRRSTLSASRDHPSVRPPNRRSPTERARQKAPRSSRTWLLVDFCFFA